MGVVLVCGTAALAQGRGPGGPGGAPGGGPGGGGHGQPPLTQPGGPGGPGGGGNNNGTPPGPNPGSTPNNSTMRGGLQLGPPGRWWDDKGFAKTLGLSKDQQKKMDTVFNASKGAILENYKALQTQESRLDAATREPKLDEAKIFAAIDAVNQARSSLEKANAHMLLMVRQEMDPEQVAKMDKFRAKPAEE